MLLRTSPCVLVVVSLCARKFTNFTQIYYVAQLINDKVTSSLHFNHVIFFVLENLLCFSMTNACEMQYVMLQN